MAINRYKSDLAFIIDELQELVTDRLDKTLNSQFGISYSEWKLLFAIFLSQNQPDQETIAANARKTPAAVSRQLGNLEEKELVERTYAQASRKTKHVKLTKQGREIINRSMLSVSRLSKEMFSVLGPDIDNFKHQAILLAEALESKS
jgi:DNA-binding MarR family transcriptional regulator